MPKGVLVGFERVEIFTDRQNDRMTDIFVFILLYRWYYEWLVSLDILFIYLPRLITGPWPCWLTISHCVRSGIEAQTYTQGMCLSFWSAQWLYQLKRPRQDRDDSGSIPNVANNFYDRYHAATSTFQYYLIFLVSEEISLLYHVCTNTCPVFCTGL